MHLTLATWLVICIKIVRNVSFTFALDSDFEIAMLVLAVGKVYSSAIFCLPLIIFLVTYNAVYKCAYFCTYLLNELITIMYVC